jgi:run domain Beclin-1 interacting cysteine-rich containing protein
MYTNPYMYSLQDLFKTKSGDLMKVLEPIVINLRDHVLRCPLCSAKGFFCEICNNTKDIIFPFELETTSVCQGKYFN